MVNMDPTRCTTTGTLYCAAKRSKPSQRAMVASSTCLKIVGSRCKMESVARPDVTAIGLPLNVPA